MYTEKLETGGFNFKNLERNQHLESKLNKSQIPKNLKKTGTTIVALVYKDGIVYGADTRATAGTIVADTDCLKLHKLAPNIYGCGAGTAGDLQYVCAMITSELELQRKNTNSQSRVSHVEKRLTNHLFRHMGHIGAAIIVGGVDVKGTSLVSILLFFILCFYYMCSFLYLLMVIHIIILLLLWDLVV